MIRGINPFHIVSIQVRPFKRHGWHPLYYKVKARQTWRNRQWLAWNKESDYDWEILNPARVIIFGTDDTILEKINCKSNAEAEKLAAELNQEMAEFFMQLGFLQKLKDGL